MQYTLKEEVKFSGIGLHTGTKTSITIKPAEPDYGIKFFRTDLIEKPCIEALVENVVDVDRAIVIGKNDIKIYTIEHLLATLTGLGITNAIIEVEGIEIPVFDGSALPLVELIEKAGLKNQHKPKQSYRIKDPVTMTNDDILIVILPSPKLKITYTINFNTEILKAQHLSLEINAETFKKELAPAQTFGFEHEINNLKEKGLIKGGSLDNAIVIGEKEILNKDKMRFEDEFVRHKIMDLIGDFTLLGTGICGHIIAIKSGHSTNVNMVTKLKNIYSKTYSGMKKFLNLTEYDDTIDINHILEVLPHRYPMLLVDRIISIKGAEKIVGLKNVSMNEAFFSGHFPKMPVMPGVLIIEAMAQVGGVMLLRKAENRGKLPFFMGLNNVKWRKPVLPGDQLIFELETVKTGSTRGKLIGKAYVEGKLVCEAELKFSLVTN